jgi:predicted acylesterase/phospholipase RssA
MSKLRKIVAAGWIGAALLAPAGPARAQEEGTGPASNLNAERAAYRAGDDGLVREVRLALVCYGGSSLAIYIHGNTKEVYRLVQASKALQQDAADQDGAMQKAVAAGERPGPGPHGRTLAGSTRNWYELLLAQWIADPQKVRTRVVVDIVAGTSAGGINGVFLAKALSHDLGLDDLTRLWLEKASLAKLTNHYFGLLRIFKGRPPVDGDAMVGWLYEALNAMDKQAVDRGARTPSLMPRGDRLDLFVTTTDRFGYPQNLVIGNPASAVEKRSRHVLHFVYPGVNRGCDPNVPRPLGEIDFFCPEWTPSLAFAARASSSIPGVFPPLNLGDTMKTISRAAASAGAPGNRVTPASLDRVVHSFFRNYELQEPNEKPTYALDTYFVDGGVLDNHPFGPAITAILGRPQGQEVKRFLLYLQPDPGTPPQAHAYVKNPGLFSTIWAGLSGLPSGQPILDNMVDVARHNTDLNRIRDIVQAEERAARLVESQNAATGDCQHLEELPIAQRFGCALGFEPGHLSEALRAADQQDLRSVRLKLEAAAQRGYVETDAAARERRAEGLNTVSRSYVSLRVHSVLDQFVTVISDPGVCDYPENSAQRDLVGKIIERWAISQKLVGDESDPTGLTAKRDDQNRFLEDFDIGYQRRQLRFVIDWINAQYLKNPDAAKRQLLDDLKGAAADRVEELTSLISGTSLDGELRRELERLAPVFCKLRPWTVVNGETVPLARQAELFLAEPASQAALATIRTQLGAVMNKMQQRVRQLSFESFRKLAPALAPDEQKEILVRYLGFPFWDRQIYPFVAFSDVGEFRDIDLYRLSPDDATLLGRRTAAQKLQGAKFAHFGAFLSRPGRESDYLWGRLDAGDRLLGLLGLGNGGAKDLFNAIVAEEKAARLVRPSILQERMVEIEKLK